MYANTPSTKIIVENLHELFPNSIAFSSKGLKAKVIKAIIKNIIIKITISL